MSSSAPPGLFITGTNTGVGKTYVGATIARLLHNSGCRVGVYKPILSGYATNLETCSREELDSSLDDDVRLWAAAGRPGALARVCSARFRAHLAAPLAARAEGRIVDAANLRSGVEYWRRQSDFVLVEGAGGLMSPITDEEYVADLAADLGYPLLVVAPNQLGAINQTLQTLITASAYRGGLCVAGVVLNQLSAASSTDRATANHVGDANFEELRKRLGANITTLASDASDFSPAMDWNRLARSAHLPGADIPRFRLPTR